MSDEITKNLIFLHRTPDQFTSTEIHNFRVQLGTKFDEFPDDYITEEMSRIERTMNCPALVFANAVLVSCRPNSKN